MNGLQFSTTMMQASPMNISLSNPPFLPIYQCDPQINQFMPLIAAFVALEIQNNAQANPLRLFMFNQHANNNYHNQEMHDSICLTVDALTHFMRQGRYRTLEEASADFVPKMVEMLCAMNLRLYPSLDQCLNPQMAGAIQNIIANFDSLMPQLNPQIAAKYAKQHGNYGMNGGTTWNNNQGGGRSSTFMNTAPTFNQSSRQNVSTASIYNTGNRTPVYESTNNNQIEKDYGGGRYSAPVQQPVPFTSTSVVKAVEEKEVKWYPSQHYPYPPVYNPFTHTMVLKKINGIVTPKFEERNMEYERHGTNTVFGTVPKEVTTQSVERTMAIVKRGVMEINAEAEQLAVKPEEHYTVTTKINQDWMQEISEEAAWFAASLKRYEESRKDTEAPIIPAIYRCYAAIAEPVIATLTEADFIKNLSNAKTFTLAREMLVAAKGDVTAELLAVCNIRMVKLVNRIVKQHLSIPGLEITDFVEDIIPLMDRIKKKFGDLASDSFIKNQREQIFSNFQLLNALDSASMTGSYMEGDVTEDSTIPEVLYLYMDYSLTFVNCLSYELEAELNPDVAAMVTKGNNPVLHQMLAGLFDDAESRVAKNKTPFGRHLIKTSDGRILEATLGHIGDNAYLLTLIK